MRDLESTPVRQPGSDADSLASRIGDNDRRALARAISLIEDDHPVGHEIVTRLFPQTGAAELVGITGAPGAGKSSLISALIQHLRDGGQGEIGVVSVDPSSPFSHGALLGDRIRLSDHFLDPEVFIRSMGARGHLGGLAKATLQVALVLDAFGKREILLETVGVGQSEIEIASVADTTLLVLMPGSGDSVQALKAGIMEIPDVIVINKADHPAARTLHQEVRSILMLDAGREWMPPIIETQAIAHVGIDKLWAAVLEHRAFLDQHGRRQRRREQHMRHQIFSLATEAATARLERRVADDPRLAELFELVNRRELDPVSCVQRLLDEVLQP